MPDKDDALAHIRQINELFYDQLKVADQKATYIMTFIVILLVWSPDVKRLFFWREAAPSLTPGWFVSFVLVSALLVSLFSALAVVLPRRRKGGTAMFWGAWPAARGEMLKLLAEQDREALARAYVDNAEALASICRSKYRCVSVAFWALIVALLAHAALIVAA